jgi:hypothetical protein
MAHRARVHDDALELDRLPDLGEVVNAAAEGFTLRANGSLFSYRR